MTPAVVLSCHTMGLGVIRSLGRMGVPVLGVFYEPGDMGQVSRYVRAAVSAPHPEHEAEAFVARLEALAAHWGRCVLIPCDDATLLTVARHRARLAARHLVACPDEAVTERFVSKQHTYALAERLGVPAPRTRLPRSAAEAEAFSRELAFPCLIKPCQSHRYFARFRRKVARVERPAELLAAYREAQAAGLEVMVQELIPGDDTCGVNYNSYFHDGEPWAEFTAEKVRLSPPAFGVPCVVKSAAVPEVLPPARRLLQALGFHGYSCTEFKRDPRDGVYKLMEVNGRFNRSSLLALRCGVNFPWLMYRHLVDGVREPLPPPALGVYWIDEVRDAVEGWGLLRHGYEWRAWLRPYLRPHIFAVWDWRDPRPFGRRCRQLLARGGARVLQGLRAPFSGKGRGPAGHGPGEVPVAAPRGSGGPTP